MDRYKTLRADLHRAVLEQAGALDVATRAAVANERNVPDALAAFVAKVHRHAYRVTDADVQALLAAGFSEDQLFEAIVSAALGASEKRLEAAMAAIEGARDASRTG